VLIIRLIQSCLSNEGIRVIKIYASQIKLSDYFFRTSPSEDQRADRKKTLSSKYNISTRARVHN